MCPELRNRSAFYESLPEKIESAPNLNKILQCFQQDRAMIHPVADNSGACSSRGDEVIDGQSQRVNFALCCGEPVPARRRWSVARAESARSKSLAI
jgi:hypothetical protein